MVDAPKLQHGQTFIKGKIDTVENFKGEYTTRIILPAVDSFSSPDFVICRSKQRIGNPEQVIEGVFQNRGYKHYYDVRDGNEQKTVNTANMYLTPVTEF